MKTAPMMLACLTALTVPATASAWSPLRAENPEVNEGNARMAEGKYAEALEAYEQAALELPEARGIQLNRGLALLAQEQLGEQAKEAFVAAADPSAPPAVRADAYYNLGIAFARDGDAISREEDYEQASAQFREAADAFKRSLRLRPGDRNAAWNLEYAMKRIREEEQKQEQQEQQEPQEQPQDSQEQEPQDGENESEESEQESQEQEPEDEGEQEQDPQQDDEGSEDSPESQSESESEANAEPQTAEQPMQQDDVQRFLDALEQNEENLPLQRARRRSAGQRPPEKDW